ncbi:MAG: polyamine aminopropyltransferase [Proteobacteria bacterium]|nr:polyamine aminopropyltransferase [Pseudomonadota bacterium]
MDKEFMVSTEDVSRHNPKILALVLGASMLFVGICGISYEYTFSRMASDILGNSVRQWAIIIGLMMFFMGVGADLQKYLPDRLIVDNFILLEILLGLLGGIGPTVSLYAFGAVHDHFILVHYFFVCAIGLMIGLEIPLLTRVNQTTVPSLKYNLGMILKMDYIGSFIGAIVWVFVLPRFFNILEISFFLGILNVGVALFTWAWFYNWMQHSRLVLVFALIVLVILTTGLLNGRKISLTAEQRLYRDPIVHTRTTPYQRIVFTKNRSGNLYMYINGHLQFSSIDEHIYHEFLVHPVLAVLPKRSRILVLGGGDGLAVREILKYSDVESVTLVDLDPEMTELAATFPELVALNKGSLLNDRVETRPPSGVSPGPKTRLEMDGHGYFRREKKIEDVQVHILNLDAYNFVESVSGIFDAIIIDFPDPNNGDLSKLYSLEFYSFLKNKLAFDGLLIQQSSSPTFAKEAFLVIGRTMKAAGFSTLPIHHSVPSFGDWGWWIAGHRERFGNKGIKERLEGDLQLPKETRYLTPDLVDGSLFFGKNALETDRRDVNTLLEDRVFYYYREAWKKMQ